MPPRAKSRPTARRRARVVTRIVAPSPTPRVPHVRLEEDPHAHIVCRGCGRIQPVPLTELDLHFLTRLAEGHPEGWSVDRIAYSLTGVCPRCREGPRA